MIETSSSCTDKLNCSVGSSCSSSEGEVEALVVGLVGRGMRGVGIEEKGRLEANSVERSGRSGRVSLKSWKGSKSLVSFEDLSGQVGVICKCKREYVRMNVKPTKFSDPSTWIG